MRYEITTKAKNIFDVKILDEPVFPVGLDYNAGIHYKTKKEIESLKSKITSVDWNDPFKLYEVGFGYCRDEGALFEICRNLRQPIINLVLIEN